ncbi:MAG TPA: hypothetical protein VGM51_08230 [Armatimonadota bacterium]|jgi:hypothetical protein
MKTPIPITFRGLSTVFGLLIAACGALSRPAPGISVRTAHSAAPAGFIEIRGLRAGPFNPANWKAGALNLVPDVRDPILPPAAGPFRNIYAPTIVRERAGYRVFYGGWDGSDTGNDRIYSVTADPGFLHWSHRSLVIDNGPFIHVNNCSAVRMPDGLVTMLTTCFPVGDNTNKPGVFASPDGVTFNGASPYVPRTSDLVSMSGYATFDKADINGMNALLRDEAAWRVYFGDFANFGQVFRASSMDAVHWTFDGPVVKAAMMVNDVKPFAFGGKTWYVMLLHQNGDRVSASVSTDAGAFPAPRTLFKNEGPQDRYIVACGLVTDSKAAYGVLYGAGAVKSLDQNRIFARWLQKRVTLKVGAVDISSGARALGPDRLRIRLPDGVTGMTGTLILHSEDGVTPLGRLGGVKLRAGDALTVTCAPSRKRSRRH